MFNGIYICPVICKMAVGCGTKIEMELSTYIHI